MRNRLDGISEFSISSLSVDFLLRRPNHYIEKSGLLVASVSVLILTYHWRKCFKYTSGNCLQRWAAFKSGIDAVDIIVIDLRDLQANSVRNKGIIAERPEIRKIRIAIAKQAHKWAFLSVAVLIGKPVAVIIDSIATYLLSPWIHIRVVIIAILLSDARRTNIVPVTIIIDTASRY